MPDVKRPAADIGPEGVDALLTTWQTLVNRSKDRDLVRWPHWGRSVVSRPQADEVAWSQQRVRRHHPVGYICVLKRHHLEVSTGL